MGRGWLAECVAITAAFLVLAAAASERRGSCWTPIVLPATPAATPQPDRVQADVREMLQHD